MNNAPDQMVLIDIYRTIHIKEAKYTFFSNADGTFHPKEAKYTFFSNAHRSFSKTDHMGGHKTSLNRFKKIEIMSSIFLDHNSLKLETNLKK